MLAFTAFAMVSVETDAPAAHTAAARRRLNGTGSFGRSFLLPHFSSVSKVVPIIKGGGATLARSVGYVQTVAGGADRARPG